MPVKPLNPANARLRLSAAALPFRTTSDIKHRTDVVGQERALAALELGGAARQLAAHCALIGREGGLVRLALDPAQSLLKTAALVDKLSQALAKHLGENVKVEIELAQSTVETPARAEQREVEATLSSARQSIDEDPTVRGFKERFGATIKTDSVKPN